jgi:hypothetical protein
MKGILLWILFGALAGIVAASFVVPPMLSWYNEAGYLAKGGQPAAMVNLPDVVRYATTRLLRGQAIGAAAGAVIFLVLGLAVGSRSGRRTGAHPPPPAPL